MAIRSFTLTNKKGEVWDLNSPDSFFTELDGLGHERNYDFEVVGNSYVEIESELEQAQPSGVLRFKDYPTCNNFIKFIQSSPLILNYVMPGVSTTYSLPVKMRKFDKKEIIDGNLPCNISFIGIGQYYKTITVENVESADVGKTYPYTYNYTYSDNTSGIVTIESDTVLDSPTKITILGPATNPSWTHYVNGVIATSGKVNCVVSTGERLVIDCASIPYSINKYDAFMNLISDCYKDSDFSTGRFVLLGFGENKISFAHAGSEDLQVIVEGRIQYESV